MGKQGRRVSDREPPKQFYGDLASWSGEARGMKASWNIQELFKS